MAGALLLAALILAGTLNNAEGAVKPVGLVAIATLMGAGGLVMVADLSLRARVSVFLVRPFIYAMLTVAAYAVGVVQGVSVQSLSTFAQVVLVLGFFFGGALLSWRRRHLQVLGTVSVAFTAFHLAWWGLAGRPANFSGYLENSNVLGSVTCMLMVFMLYAQHGSARRKLWGAAVGAAGVLVFASTTRSVWAAIGVGLVTYAVWGWLAKSRRRHGLYFVSVAAGIAAVTYVLPRVSSMPGALYLNRLVFRYTGKNLFSGREDFWGVLLDAVWKEPWLGYGAGALPAQFTNLPLSAHNFYLQTALQVGLPGMLLFVALMASLWGLFWRGRHLFFARLTGSVLIGIMVHQTFEVSLTQTNLSIGVLQWLALAVGVSKTLEALGHEKKAERREQRRRVGTAA